MHRVYVISFIYKQLEQIAQVHGMESGAELLDLVLRTQRGSLTEASRPLLRLLSQTPNDGTTAVRASYECAHYMQQLALVYNVPQATVASYIVQDTLPILRAFPDAIPGFVELKRTHKIIPKTTVTLQITVYGDVRRRINQHLQESPRTRHQYGDANHYIRATLRSLPSAEIIQAITEGHTDAGAFLPIDKMRGDRPRSVRVELDTYYTLQEISRVTGLSICRIASYILLRSLVHLKAFEDEPAQAITGADVLQDMLEVYFKTRGPG